MKLTSIIRSIGGSLRLASRVTALTGGLSTVDSVVVTAPGTGYTSAPAVNFSSGAAAATATVAAGGIISIAVTAGGSYSGAAPTVSFAGGGGSGATATAVMLATSLDAIPTLTLPVGTFVLFVMGGALQIYELVAGTDAEASPFTVRGDDYAGGTNEKVWKWRSVGLMRLAGFTVGTLPTGTVGDIAYVTDATAPAYGVALVGGGAVVAKAFFNGVTWIAD